MSAQLDKWKEEVLQLTEDAMESTNDKLIEFYREALIDIKVKASQYINNYEKLSFSKRLEAERLLESGKEIQNIIIRLNKGVDGTIKDHITDEAVRGYYGTWYEMDGLNNMSLSIGRVNERFIQEVVNRGVDGANFSQRLHRNADELSKLVEREILKSAYDGKGYAEISRRLEQHTNESYYQALRIARTEGGRASSQATDKAYRDAKAMGLVFKKEWISARDNRTRSSHKHLNGQRVELDEMFITRDGKQATGPLQFGIASEDINCRCTTRVVFEDLDYTNDELYEKWIEGGGTYQSWIEEHDI